MTTEDYKLTVEDVPRLKRFRTFCLAGFATCAVGVIIITSITFAPEARTNAARLLALLLIAAGYFVTIGIRTKVMITQLLKGREPTFKRPAPKWITVVFLMFELAALVMQAKP